MWGGKRPTNKRETIMTLPRGRAAGGARPSESGAIVMAIARAKEECGK